MPRGGYRPGAGRKKKDVNASEHLRALAQQAISDDIWLEIFKKLAAGARVGVHESTALLLRYALGVNLTADPEPPAVDVADTDPASPQPAAHSGRAPDS